MPTPLRLLILGAHPDDAEFHAGGLAALYRQHGHTVKMISLTNGDAGHQQMSGPPLAARRRQEAAAAGRVIGAEYVTWDNHDGQLMPTLEVRYQVIRELRTFQPDLVLTHRTNDYHPDHRAVGNVVRDASYMVTVPPVVPDVPILRKDPVVAYMPDPFTKPYPLEPHVVIDITEQVDTVVADAGLPRVAGLRVAAVQSGHRRFDAERSRRAAAPGCASGTASGRAAMRSGSASG